MFGNTDTLPKQQSYLSDVFEPRALHMYSNYSASTHLGTSNALLDKKKCNYALTGKQMEIG